MAEWQKGISMRVLAIIAVTFALLGGVIVFVVPFTVKQIDKKHSPVGEWVAHKTTGDVIETFYLTFAEGTFVETIIIDGQVTETNEGTWKNTYVREFTIKYNKKGDVTKISVIIFKKNYKVLHDTRNENDYMKK
jgi:hypothetical protein